MLTGEFLPLPHPCSVPGEVLSRAPVPAPADFLTAVPGRGAVLGSQGTVPVPQALWGVPVPTSTLRSATRGSLPGSLTYTEHCPDPIPQEKQDAQSNAAPR